MQCCARVDSAINRASLRSTLTFVATAGKLTHIINLRDSFVQDNILAHADDGTMTDCYRYRSAREVVQLDNIHSIIR